MGKRDTIPNATLTPSDWFFIKMGSDESHKSLRVQELCESRGGRPGLSVLMSLTVSVDVIQHRTMLRHWSQFVPNTSTDIRGHEALHHQRELRSETERGPEC